MQQEIHRREYEVGRALQGASQARQAVQSLQQVFAPYMHNIQASHNGDAIGMVGSLLQADNTLRHGSPRERAQLAADIISNYGVDVVVLDQLLAGRQVPESPEAAYARELDQRLERKLAPVMQYFGQMQEARQQAVQAREQQAVDEVEVFRRSPGHEHIDAVKGLMADMMEVGARNNLPLTLQEAYDRAVALHPELAKTAGQAAERQRVEAAVAAAQRAKRAASSLPSGGAPIGQPEATAGESPRSDLLRAWDQHQR